MKNKNIAISKSNNTVTKAAIGVHQNRAKRTFFIPVLAVITHDLKKNNKNRDNRTANNSWQTPCPLHNSTHAIYYYVDTAVDESVGKVQGPVFLHSLKRQHVINSFFGTPYALGSYKGVFYISICFVLHCLAHPLAHSLAYPRVRFLARSRVRCLARCFNTCFRRY